MTIVSALRDYIMAYAGLAANAPVWVNYLGPAPTEYAIVPLAGGKILDRYLNGGSVREFPFALQSTESIADNQTRLATDEFYEAFSDWLEQQTEVDILPDLGAGKTALSLEAVNWGILFEQGESGTGIYQLTCLLTYEQAP